MKRQIVVEYPELYGSTQYLFLYFSSQVNYPQGLLKSWKIESMYTSFQRIPNFLARRIQYFSPNSSSFCVITAATHHIYSFVYNTLCPYPMSLTNPMEDISLPPPIKWRFCPMSVFTLYFHFKFWKYKWLPDTSSLYLFLYLHF